MTCNRIRSWSHLERNIKRRLDQEQDRDAVNLSRCQDHVSELRSRHQGQDFWHLTQDQQKLDSNDLDTRGLGLHSPNDKTIATATV